jgi:hypothetical protein
MVPEIEAARIALWAGVAGGAIAMLSAVLVATIEWLRESRRAARERNLKQLEDLRAAYREWMAEVTNLYAIVTGLRVDVAGATDGAELRQRGAELLAYLRERVGPGASKYYAVSLLENDPEARVRLRSFGDALSQGMLRMTQMLVDGDPATAFTDFDAALASFTALEDWLVETRFKRLDS